MYALQTLSGVDEALQRRIVSGMEAVGSELSDEELLRQSLDSPALFELLMLRYQREFLSRARAVVKSTDDAEDVAQEAFIRMYRFGPKFDPKNGSFRTWALTILMNVARTRYQRQVKERSATVHLEDTHYESLADQSGEHEDYLATDEVVRALGRVDSDTARLLRRAYIDGIPYVQIASEEGTTVGAIKARIHRAKTAVRAAAPE